MTEEEKRRIIDTAEKLGPMVATEGWEFVVAYTVARKEILKNQLSKINLSEELSKAAQCQGEIKALNNVINRVNEVIQQAKRIEEEEINKKKEKK